jgi:hypothetical protein
LGDLVGRLFAHIFRIHSLWHTHHLEGVCLHEECKGVSADFFAS